MTNKFLSILLMTALMGQIFGLAQASPVQPARGSLGTLVLARLEKESTSYRDLQTLAEQQHVKDTATGTPSNRARRLTALIELLRAEALSVTTVDPENPDGHPVLNYTTSSGQVIRIPSLTPSNDESNPASFNVTAGMICRLIIESAKDYGRLPFDLSPTTQQAVDDVMKVGFEAAKKKDFLSASVSFEKARALAPYSPDILYNLGLAESKIPGRELRAVAWFGAYLAADWTAPNAPIIREKINELKPQGLNRFVKITEQVANDVNDAYLKQFYLVDLVELWACLGNFAAAEKNFSQIQDPYQSNTAVEKIVLAQIKQKDLVGAIQTTKRIRDVSVRGSSLRSIAEAQAIAGDVQDAFQTAASIEDQFCKSTAYQWLGRDRTRAGDNKEALIFLQAAVRSSDEIPDAQLKDVAKQYIAISQAEAGDFIAAFQTIAGIRDLFQKGLAQMYTGECQAKAGDATGAQQTLTEALKTKDQMTVDHSRETLEQAYREIKGRIESGTAGIREDTADKKPDTSIDGWTWLNTTQLNEPVFLNFKAYIDTLPSESPAKIFQAMQATAKKMIDAQDLIDKMLQQ